MGQGGARLRRYRPKAHPLLTEEERKQVPKIKDLWLDIGAGSKEDVLKVRGSAIRSRWSCDFERAAQPPGGRLPRHGRQDRPLGGDGGPAQGGSRKAPVCRLCGLDRAGGDRSARRQTSAFSVDPQVGMAVDVTHATDCPTVEKKEEGDIQLGRGPVIYRGPNMNPKVVERLLHTAEENQIAYQLARLRPGLAAPTPIAIQINRAGVAAALISIPNRYMHSPVEMISLEDIDARGRPVGPVRRGLTPDANFMP